ncbi:hypothetical protein ACGFZA_32655 [Streptomyces sp. NPDC048211]|uniref:hypothetical protein n=1 Tax=Streptomyces sp. NPDC048211 TaxID=3365516 RepID=UPI00371D3DAF
MSDVALLSEVAGAATRFLGAAPRRLGAELSDSASAVPVGAILRVECAEPWPGLLGL